MKKKKVKIKIKATRRFKSRSPHLPGFVPDNCACILRVFNRPLCLERRRTYKCFVSTEQSIFVRTVRLCRQVKGNAVEVPEKVGDLRSWRARKRTGELIKSFKFCSQKQWSKGSAVSGLILYCKLGSVQPAKFSTLCHSPSILVISFLPPAPPPSHPFKRVKDSMG